MATDSRISMGSIIIFMLYTNCAYGKEIPHPSSGFLYKMEEDHSLTYRCDEIELNTIKCFFNQTAVRPKRSIGYVEAELNKLKQYPIEKIIKEADFCKDSDFVNMTRSEMENRIDNFNKSRDVPLARIENDREEALANHDALVNFCKKPSLDSYINISKKYLEREAQTCIVSSNYYEMKFMKRSDTVWTVINEESNNSEGDCGILFLDRFEYDESGKNWNYVTGKAIQNPSANFFMGMKCSDFDKKEYKYVWNDYRARRVQCVYVEFSPL